MITFGNGRRFMWYIIAIASGIAVAGMWHLGWFSARSEWQEASGWNRIPPELRAIHPGVTADHDPWIRWLGHSGFVIRWHGTTLILDPNLSERCTVSKRVMQPPPAWPDVGPAHVLISHAHYDHLNQDTLVTLGGVSSILVPAGSETFLDRIDTNRVEVVPVELDTAYMIGTLRITPAWAAHNGNRFHPLRSRYSAVGYMIQSPGGRTLYYAGDTADHHRWTEWRERFHPDIAILPIGAYAPRYPLRFHHLNPEEAVQAAMAMGVRRMIPCHFGTFTLSLDRPGHALPRFARAAGRAGLDWSMPELLTENDLGIITAAMRKDDHDS